MKSEFKKRIAGILAALMVAETITGGMTGVYASSEPDILLQGYEEESAEDILSEPGTPPDKELPADSAEGLSPLKQVSGMDHVEGEVIVCAIESSDPASEAAADDIGRDAACDDLLDGAEDLMDVSGAAGAAVEDAGDPSLNADEPQNDKASPDGNETQTVLKLIHSDEYTTSELMEMLGARDDVIFVEPNYIHTIEEPEAEIYESAYLTDDAVTGDDSREDRSADASDIIAEEDLEDTGDTDTGDIQPDRAWEGQDLTDKQYAYGAGPGGIDIPDWNSVSVNAENTVVAVVDTGVDYNNPDLKDVMWDKGLEYDALVKLGGGRYGINPPGTKEFGYSTDDPLDRGGHGTHVAGSIAAAWNGFGVSGAANGARIMALNVTDYRGSFLNSDLVKCYNYVLTAKKAGVNVVAVNNSWGGPVESLIFRYIVRALAEAGVVSCFSSGNNNENNDLYGGTSDTFGGEPGEITVNSSDARGKKSDFSNWGIRSTHVFAPGTEILSTYPSGLGDLYGGIAATAMDTNNGEIKDDYEDGSLETAYFGYRLADNDNELAVSENTVSGAGIGNKSLVIKGVSAATTYDVGVLIINKESDVRLFPGGEYEAVLTHMATYPNIYLKLFVKTIDGEYAYAGGGYSAATFNETTIRLPADTDLDDLSFKLMAAPDNESEETYDIYIDGIRLTEETEGSPYAMMSGTSMACPAATGAVAVIAGKYPNDSAAKRAARILAGVRSNDALKDMCITGGIVNVRNSLDESKYTPVIQKVWLNETGTRLNVAGYFFGESPELKLVQAETDLVSVNTVTPTPGSEDGYSILTTDIPEGLKSGELLVTVTNSAASQGRSTGRLYASIVLPETADAGYYTRLPLPENSVIGEAVFGNTMVIAMGAVDGRIVISGILNNPADKPVTWIYSISENRFERCLIGDDAIKPAGGLCAYNKKIVYIDDESLKFTIFDPASGKVVDSALIEGTDYINPAPVLYLTQNNELLCFARKRGESGKTNVYLIDTGYLRGTKLGELNGEYYDRAVAGEASDGEIYITDKKQEKLARFKITGEGYSKKITDPGYCALKFNGDVQGHREKANGCSVKNGFILINACEVSDNNLVVNDNYFLELPSGGEAESLTYKAGLKRIAPLRLYNGKCAAYKGKVYILGMTYDEESVFCCMDADTYDTGDAEVPKPEDSIKITLTAQNNGEVQPGKKIKITAMTEPSVPADRIHWYSDDGSLATVDQKGTVTGVRPGIVWIYAAVDAPFGYKKACRVQVYEPTTSIKLSTQNVKLAEGCRFEMTACAEPFAGASQQFEWEVSEPSSCRSLIKADENKDKRESDPRKIVLHAGNLPAGVKSAKAKVTFRALDGSRKKSVLTVTVYRATEGISIKKGSKDVTGTLLTMTENKSMSLKAVAAPLKAASGSLNWWSTDASVATVKNGKVKATGQGSARIYAQATDGTGKKVYCTVSVNAPVRKAELNTSGTIYLGRDTSYDVSINRVTPAACSTYSVLWVSSKPEVVSVSGNEENADLASIDALKAGSAKVWAVITNDAAGGRKTVKTNALTVKVVQSSASANSVAILSGKKDITGNTETVSNAAARVVAGKTLKLTAKAYDDKGTKLKKPYYVWTTSNPDVATVADGKVQTYKEGAVDIGVHVVPADGSQKWVSEYCTIYVYEPVKSVGINFGTRDNVGLITLTSSVSSDDAVELEAGYTVKAKSGNDSTRENKGFEWSSSNPEVLEFYIGEHGWAMFLPKKAGTALVSVRALDGSNKSAKCKVKVISSVTKLTLDISNLPGNASVSDTKEYEGSKDVSGLKEGDSFTIRPSLTPAGAMDSKVVYISSDPAAVTVNAKGKVKLLKKPEGEPFITVMTEDGGLCAYCNLK